MALANFDPVGHFNAQSTVLPAICPSPCRPLVRGQLRIYTQPFSNSPATHCCHRPPSVCPKRESKEANASNRSRPIQGPGKTRGAVHPPFKWTLDQSNLVN